MVNLERTADLLAQVTPVRVAAALCAKARSPRATCQACAAACPIEAVALDSRPQIDPDRCTACGLCAAACPTGAIRLETPSPAQVLAAARKAQGGEPVLVCKAEAAGVARLAPGRQVVLPCIGMLTSELLAGLLATVEERLLIWRSAACDRCSYGPAALRQIRRAVGGVEALYPGRVVIGGDPARLDEGRRERGEGSGDGGGAGLSGTGTALDRTLLGQDRRAFLGSALRGGGDLFKTLVGDWLLKPTPAETPKAIFDITGLPGRRQVLQAALEANPPAAGAQLLERRRTVGPSCTLCPVCSRLCPSGALQVTEVEGRAALHWQASRCTDCGLCRDVCPSRAMADGEPITAAAFMADQPEELVSGSQSTCSCGQTYWRVAGGPDRCIACRMAAGRLG